MGRQTIARVEPNLLDKAIAIVAPRTALGRQEARMRLALAGGYTGARYDRRELRDFNVSATSADQAVIPDLPTLRARSRDLARNECIAGGAIENVCRNAVGSGLSAHPTPDAKALGWTDDQAVEWSERVYGLFDSWASSRDADITRTQSFYEGQELWVRSSLESGDVFGLMPKVPVTGFSFKTRFQIIEADRIASPSGEGQPAAYGDPDTVTGQRKQTGPLQGGVDLDSNGAPVGYCILRKHPNPIGFWSRTVEWDYYLAFGARTGRRQVLHGFDRKRPGQTRGVPYLAPVISLVKQLGRYTDNEVMAAVITSMFTVFITSGSDGDAAPAAGAPGVVPEMALGNGIINQLAPGESVTFADPKRPSNTFDPFVQAVIRQIGMRLNLPFEVLIMHFTASYSAARAAIMTAWQFYKDRRNFLVNSFCQPMYEAVLDELVYSGKVEAPGYFSDPMVRAAYCRCEWVGDAPAQIDPKKEADASKAKVDAGFSSIERETMKLEGVSSRDIHKQRAREHAERVTAGLEPAIANATATEPVTDSLPQDAEGADGNTDTSAGTDTENETGAGK